MQYWTKNGSIPSTETDGTEGWQPAPEPPTDVPADKELVWLNWEWIIRDPKPQDRAGWQWNWQHESRTWVESAWQTELQPIEAIELPEIVVTTQLSGFTTSQISEIS
jgi:hypothetical protein